MSLIIDRPARPNGLYFVVDSRTRYDREIQDAKGETQVFKNWAYGIKALGRAGWAGVTRIALYDYLQDAGAVDKAVRRSELTSFLKAEKPRMTLLLKPRSSRSRDKERDIEENKGLKGHQAWIAAHAPASLEDIGGAVFDAPWGPTIGLLNPINNDFSYSELVRRHLLGAHAFATGRLKLLEPPKIAFMPGDPNMWEFVRHVSRLATAGVPISVDIETVPSTKAITAIGLAAGDFAICCPWDAFPIAGGSRIEPAGPSELRRAFSDIIASSAPKVFHNGIDFDVPYLHSLGYTVGGYIHDTMATCAAASNQWPKGLQKAVAAEFLIPAWKSYHADARYDLDDDRAWTSNPEHLREYCAKDAWYDNQLFLAHAYKIGIMPDVRASREIGLAK